MKYFKVLEKFVQETSVLETFVLMISFWLKGGVHSSRNKCKGVQSTQINWQELLKNVEIQNIGCLLTFSVHFCKLVDAPLHFSGNGRALAS